MALQDSSFISSQLEYNPDIFVECSKWGSNNFASIKWTGWYSQDGIKQDVTLSNFHIYFDGRIIGNGIDEVGKFSIDGKMQNSGALAFVKQYEGQHSVNYKGQLVNCEIFGGWEIKDNCSGEFGISPASTNFKGWETIDGVRSSLYYDMCTDNNDVFGIGMGKRGGYTIRGRIEGSKVQFAKISAEGLKTFYYGEMGNSPANIFITGWCIVEGRGHGRFFISCENINSNVNFLQNAPASIQGSSQVIDTEVQRADNYVMGIKSQGVRINFEELSDFMESYIHLEVNRMWIVLELSTRIYGLTIDMMYQALLNLFCYESFRKRIFISLYPALVSRPSEGELNKVLSLFTSKKVNDQVCSFLATKRLTLA